MAGPPALRQVASSGGAPRWVTDLHPADALRYRTLVDAVQRPVDLTLPPGVVANRTTPRGRTVPFTEAARTWRSLLRAMKAERPGHAAIVADVRRCYRSIGPGSVAAGLGLAGVRPEHNRAVTAFLDDIRDAGIDGLPIGPAPSAILANAVLAIGDRAALDHGIQILRWVDDVMMIGDARTVVRAFDAWVAALGGLGMAPNDAKTQRIAALGDAAPGLPGPVSTLSGSACDDAAR